FAHVAVTTTAAEVGERGAVGGESEGEGVAVADIQQRGLGLVDASVNNAPANKPADRLCKVSFPLRWRGARGWGGGGVGRVRQRRGAGHAPQRREAAPARLWCSAQRCRPGRNETPG